MNKRKDHQQLDSYMEFITRLPTMVHAIDKDGILINVSEFWLKKLGYERDEVIGQHSTEFLTEESRRYAEQTALPDFFAKGFIENIPYQFLRKDNAIIDVLLSANSIYDKEGAFICSLATIVDITEKKRSEDQLQESEIRYRNLVGNIPGTVYQVVMSADGQFRFDYLSDNCLDLFGYSAEEIKKDAQLIFDNIPQPDADEVIQVIERSASTLTRYSLEHRFIKKNGERIWIYASSTPRILPDGTIIWDGIGLDITEQKENENEKYKNHKILIEAEKLANVGGWEWDMVEDQWSMSDNWLEIHGCKKRDLNSEELLAIAYEDDRRQIQEAFNSAVESGETYEIEHRIVRQDSGEVRYIRAHGTVKRAQDGTPLKLYGVAQDITDQKHTQIALEKSELQYRQLLDLAQEGIWVIDHEDKTRFVNSSMARMLGYTAEEMLGKSLFDFMDEQRIKIAHHKIEQRKRGISEQHDFEFIRKDGDRIYTTIETAPIFDSNGRYNGAIAGILDTTERRHKDRVQESQLKLVEYATTHTSRELLSKFLDEAEALTDSQIGFYHFFDDNKKILSLQTWSSNTISTMCKADKTRAHYPLEKAGVWADCVRNKKTVVHNNYDSLPHKKGVPEGHAKVIRELVVPVIRDGDVVAVLGVGNKGNDYNENDVDIVQVLSDLAWETVSRKLAEESLHASQAKLENLLQTIQAGVIVHDVETNQVTDFNSAALKILGMTGEQILGKSTVEPGWNFITEEGKIMNVLDFPVNIVKRTKKPLIDYIVGIKKPSQPEPTWAIVKANPQFDQNGELRQIIVSSMDITELRKTQEQLRKKDQQLIQAQKMESIGNLAGGIAHDFNNILTSIIGFTELALEGAEKGSNQENDLEEVYAAGNRAKELVKQILAFARQSEEELKPVRLSDIIADTLKLLRPSTPSSIEIITSIDSSSYTMANPSQLHQVVLNLCTNSIHAMQSHGEILEIGLRDIVLSAKNTMKNSLLADDKYIEFSVSDNGPGVEPDIINRIFEPYYTTKGVGEGTGMGLAMVKGIVESWGGQITVKSKPKKKTTFTVILPISTSRDHAGLPQSEPYSLGTEHILFVDDEPPIAKMTSRILESLGYKVTVRTSSVEALQLFQAKPDAFDLVISDMTMPYITGDELSIEIRKIRQDIPIILCTGYSNKINDEGARQLGINAFAFKPFKRSDFAKIIRDVLDAC